MIRPLCAATSFIVFLAACKKGDQVPAYVAVSSVSLNASAEEGSNSSKITDVWVSVNDRSLGSWELPARVPVLGTGSATITITPAIKRNGSYDDRLRYPFYTTSSTTVDLVPEGTVDLEPVVSYAEGANFWVEGFEDAGSDFAVSTDSDTTLLLYTEATDPGIVEHGNSCGGFVLDPDHERISLYTNEDFLPSNGPAFIELDYSTDINLTVGITYLEGGVTRSEPWLVLVPTAINGGLDWNKAYIDISSFMGTAGISQRDIYITASLPSGQASAHVYLDNVKLVRSDP